MSSPAQVESTDPDAGPYLDLTFHVGHARCDDLLPHQRFGRRLRQRIRPLQPVADGDDAPSLRSPFLCLAELLNRHAQSESSVQNGVRSEEPLRTRKIDGRVGRLGDPDPVLEFDGCAAHSSLMHHHVAWRMKMGGRPGRDVQTRVSRPRQTVECAGGGTTPDKLDAGHLLDGAKSEDQVGRPDRNPIEPSPFADEEPPPERGPHCLATHDAQDLPIGDQATMFFCQPSQSIHPRIVAAPAPLPQTLEPPCGQLSDPQNMSRPEWWSAAAHFRAKPTTRPPFGPGQQRSGVRRCRGGR